MISCSAPSSPLFFATSREDLKQHNIRIGKARVDAQCDEANHVYWPLPGCKRTYDKTVALQAANRIHALIGGPEI